MIMDDGGKRPVPTGGGRILQASCEDGKIVLEDERARSATVTIADVKQSNGVTHVIDKDLLPKQPVALRRCSVPSRLFPERRRAKIENQGGSPMKRRKFLFCTAMLPFVARPAAGSEEVFEITRTEAEWRAMLTDLEYRVMREDGTERAGSSPLDKEYDPGLYHCKGCDLPLYSSEAKYDSGTGWPSFYESLPGAIRTKEDNSLLTRRTEVHCRRCGSHLGHIFNDGPPPTGKRHCLNGVSLRFVPA